MVKCGIVGLPNVGKSTLFNALLKKRVALSANYPFATVEPNIGVVAVPDERLEKLGELVAAEKSTPGESGPTPGVSQRPPIVSAVTEFVDIAGLVKGASTGEGLGNKFLSHIREVDAIIHVLRDFGDIGVIREGSVNPQEDKLTVETELALADLQVVEKLVSGQEKQAKVTKDVLEVEKLEILQKSKGLLEKGGIREIRDIGGIGDKKIREWFKTLPLLSIKPVLYVYNVSEEDLRFKIEDLRLEEDKMAISAKIEEEMADLSEDERKEYLKEIGIKETGLERLIKKAYHLLGLISFLTAGKKEVRAWTLRAGENALRASGVIHTDFMKNFIRAEVIEYEKLVEVGSYVAAKSKGLIRTEGKDYIVKDGDVIEFLIGS
ncbi:redox-regulated ATPase YchF [Candidatus Daviesbacteria bacterium]|nr:redox-regulated ATPase YchF [Candidatus Daviesbacteria bacterium]